VVTLVGDGRELVGQLDEPGVGGEPVVELGDRINGHGGALLPGDSAGVSIVPADPDDKGTIINFRFSPSVTANGATF
jgi:hypothetical protein